MTLTVNSQARDQQRECFLEEPPKLLEMQMACMLAALNRLPNEQRQLLRATFDQVLAQADQSEELATFATEVAEIIYDCRELSFDDKQATLQLPLMEIKQAYQALVDQKGEVE